MQRNSFVIAALGAIALAAAAVAGPLGAQPYPNKPLRLILPMAPGGPTDILGRIVQTRFTELLGQTVVPDNRAGAGSNVGTEIAVKARPDGYTILLSSSALVANISIYPKMPYDLLADLASITLIGVAPNWLVVNATLPVSSVKDLIALAKAKPGELTYGSAGIGSPTHIAPEMFQMMTGTKMLHVPYKGGNDSIVALLGGSVTMCFASTPTALPLVRSGRLKALGVTSLKRYSGMPEIPTIAETLPGFDLVGFYAVLAPARTPPPIVARLNRGIVDAVKTPEVANRLTRDGFEVTGSSPRELDAFFRTEIPKYGKIIRAANIRPE